MTTTSTMIQGIVGSSCNGCSLLPLVLFCLKFTKWHQERTSRPKHGRGFAGVSYS